MGDCASVDDKLLDTSNDLYASEDEATLARAFGEKDECNEVFIKPLKTEPMAIRINDVWFCAIRLTL